MASRSGATIYVKVSETQNAMSTIDTGSKEIKTKQQKNKASLDSKGNSNSATGALMLQYATQMANEVISAGLDQLNRYLTLSDNIQAQRNITNASNFISKSISIGSAIVQAGMVGGPIGVAFASVASAITLGYDIYRNYQAQQDTVNKLQVQLDYSRERSGYSLTSGGR